MEDKANDKLQAYFLKAKSEDELMSIEEVENLIAEAPSAKSKKTWNRSIFFALLFSVAVTLIITPGYLYEPQIALLSDKLSTETSNELSASKFPVTPLSKKKKSNKGKANSNFLATIDSLSPSQLALIAQIKDTSSSKFEKSSLVEKDSISIPLPSKATAFKVDKHLTILKFYEKKELEMVKDLLKKEGIEFRLNDFQQGKSRYIDFDLLVDGKLFKRVKAADYGSIYIKWVYNQEGKPEITWVNVSN